MQARRSMAISPTLRGLRQPGEARRILLPDLPALRVPRPPRNTNRDPSCDLPAPDSATGQRLPDLEFAGRAPLQRAFLPAHRQPRPCQKRSSKELASAADDTSVLTTRII